MQVWDRDVVIQQKWRHVALKKSFHLNNETNHAPVNLKNMNTKG